MRRLFCLVMLTLLLNQLRHQTRPTCFDSLQSLRRYRHENILGMGCNRASAGRFELQPMRENLRDVLHQVSITTKAL